MASSTGDNKKQKLKDYREKQNKNSSAAKKRTPKLKK